MTLGELKRWLVLADSHYHGTLHHGLNQTPASRWSEGISRFGNTSTVIKPWIVNRNKLQIFIIRRNPLDLSRIWGLRLEPLA